MPDGLQVIDYLAFSDCEALKEVKFPDVLQEIGNYAFAGCDSLEEVKTPESVKINNTIFSKFTCRKKRIMHYSN